MQVSKGDHVRIFMVGGGSGGHVTPLKYVAEEIKKLDPQSQINYVGPKKDRFTNLIETDKNFDGVFTINSGKYRRYNRGLLRELLDLRTQALNILDIFKLIIGFFQSCLIVTRHKPDVVLSKGANASVPFLLAVKLLSRAAIYTHDSDALPGLAHRISGKWADINFLGQAGRSVYPEDKSEYVGVPINQCFTAKNDAHQNHIVVVGGSLGASTLNKFAKQYVIPEGYRMTLISGQEIALGEGKTNISFISDPAEYCNLLASAEVIVSRAGATALNELSALAKPLVAVPADHLADQQENAKQLVKNEAALVAKDDPESIAQCLDALLKDNKLQTKLSSNLNAMFKHDAAVHIAKRVVGKTNV